MFFGQMQTANDKRSAKLPGIGTGLSDVANHLSFAISEAKNTPGHSSCMPQGKQHYNASSLNNLLSLNLPWH